MSHTIRYVIVGLALTAAILAYLYFQPEEGLRDSSPAIAAPDTEYTPAPANPASSRIEPQAHDNADAGRHESELVVPVTLSEDVVDIGADLDPDDPAYGFSAVSTGNPQDIGDDIDPDDPNAYAALAKEGAVGEESVGEDINPDDPGYYAQSVTPGEIEDHGRDIDPESFYHPPDVSELNERDQGKSAPRSIGAPLDPDA